MTTLELMGLTAVSALTSGAAFAMEYVTAGTLFAAITLVVVIAGVALSPVD